MMLPTGGGSGGKGGGAGPLGGEGGRDDLLAAIRKGATGGLKKASDRVMAAKPESEGDSHNGLLAEIRKGRELKKVVVQKKVAHQDPTSLGGLSVAAILNRRAALANDSETDDDDDDEWDD